MPVPVPPAASRPARISRRRAGAGLALVLALAVAPAAPPPLEAAAPAELGAGTVTIALAALRDGRGTGRGTGAETCRATLHITNAAAVRVESFSLRLVLFAADGTVLRQVSVLAMPLKPGETTRATFPALEGACARIGAIRLRDFPLCADADGRRLDCRAAARLESRTEVPFAF